MYSTCFVWEGEFACAHYLLGSNIKLMFIGSKKSQFEQIFFMK